MLDENKILLDKLGEPFTIKICDTGCFDIVLEMYDTHMPEPVAQGLPPLNKKVRRNWITSLLKLGTNFAAIKEGKVIGHSAIMPDIKRNDAEYLIFVATPHRNRGLATVLTMVAIEAGRETGLQSIWLTVESDNFRAIKLYRKAGFEFTDKGLSERKMSLKL